MKLSQRQLRELISEAFKETQQDTFDIPDGPLTKQDVKALGIPLTVDRGAKSDYFARRGRVYNTRRSPRKTSSYSETLVWVIGVPDWKPELGPMGHWTDVETEFVGKYPPRKQQEAREITGVDERFVQVIQATEHMINEKAFQDEYEHAFTELSEAYKALEALLVVLGAKPSSQKRRP